MAVKAYYSASVPDFLSDSPERILGILAAEHHHNLEEQQRSAWVEQIAILKSAVASRMDGCLFLELYIPRMGKRADALIIVENIIFVIEFKVGAHEFSANGLDQVEDYALDLKNFHQGSHAAPIVPVLVSTKAPDAPFSLINFADDLVALPAKTNALNLGPLIDHTCACHSFPVIKVDDWRNTGYKPTPTIVEAAQVLYRTHSVEDIKRRDAGARNLQQTSDCVRAVIDGARRNLTKTICFVTGVPGSGKTLAGLNLATLRSDEHRDEHAVFLSGNGPLVAVLREALARDKSQRDGVPKKTAERDVRSFIQNIHHFRDEYVSKNDIPIEKVVVFDEAQRAWTRKQASNFMQRKRGQSNFDMSEPEFLVSVMDRHADWCTIICLVGGGQEINTGEAGISEWISALETRFPRWHVFTSPLIKLPEYGAQNDVDRFLALPRVHAEAHLHLAVSMRSFRAETLSTFIGHIVDNEPQAAREEFRKIHTAYPICLTRSLSAARTWLRSKARGTERFGLVASSGAQRLRPEGIHIKAEIDPPNWFLNSSDDVRSSCYLEEVASEFDIQGLELDWVGVCWDGDFHQKDGNWTYQSFKGTKWQSMNDASKRLYLKNTYRVLLTRARQGMVIFVPKADGSDKTRSPSFYDGTFEYLRLCGVPVME
jgi:hypothetical protein